MATSAPRVQGNSGPRPVAPTHVYQPSSQMMMIPQQQLSFAGSPQSFFIPPGQVGAHTKLCLAASPNTKYTLAVTVAITQIKVLKHF